MNLLEKLLAGSKLKENRLVVVGEDTEINFYEGWDDEFMPDHPRKELQKQDHFTVNLPIHFWGRGQGFNGTLKFYLEGVTVDDCIKDLPNQIEELQNGLVKLQTWLKENVYE